MDLILLIISIVAVAFGVYWYFIHVPNYYGYISSGGEHLKTFLQVDKMLELSQDQSDDIWILDVREEEYFLMGHIPNARNFPHHEIEKHYHQIPKDKALILYCDLTIKTQNVIIFLEEKGYTKMLNWGKYKRWKYEETVEESISI
ncbi:rhodanese-like domain-containing protein [Marinifilum caeruleilacunae]|uniref:Rhodanese-like domain-containing protein n=1 Tax=Marinifilum caeruleilacunae TaxID=2499076 RepID=A0ABX1WUA7_9BACT|nr:rhodanese-like domain-containing protein [Marinifilum caeruleilacunae]NOU59509.1 rhodanese-like domain-containing protein [Marinifilum caeruleilacunae]